ncbi:MAG: hypothetical protein ISS61_16670 [Desulfobacteraceae bacterium]|nr:hypothetical protein [Desulfobacteraceae bacterium]
MAVFNHIPMGQEGLKEIYRWVDDFTDKNNAIAYKTVLGKSPDNWDIPAVFVTNRELPDDDKQIAVVTLARHGQELGARVVGPQILHDLTGDDAKAVRDTQLVIVIPVVNPEGFILKQFHSSMTRLTRTERLVLGRLFNAYPPDMVIDFHSLGKAAGSKYDCGDLEAIIPANTTRWAMDEQIHYYVAQRMQEAAENAGWPYEIHSLEDLAAYRFAEREIGNMPYAYLQEKVYLLHMMDSHDNYDIPEEAAYTNYTCGPAYEKWHTLVFGMETNHWGITDPGDIALSGAAPCAALLKMGSTRFPWEKDRGYPVNILHGDFRISLRPSGKNAVERRASRTRIWGERMYFNLPQREMPDPETTITRVRYFGKDLPMEFALCLRMRQSPIKSITLDSKELEFETFEDRCSTFVHIPLVMDRAGTIELIITHPPA